MSDIILASQSPRRAELLDQLGISYRVQVADIKEDPMPEENVESLVKRLAIEKSQALNNNALPVLGADTLGIIDDELLVKPENYEHAYTMLSRMSGNWHSILTAVAITHNQQSRVLLNKNRVLFRTLTKKEIEAYWQTGEPQDKAGAYAIQGIAASFVERIEGSYSGIMGLPLFETSQLLAQTGVNVLIG